MARIVRQGGSRSTVFPAMADYADGVARCANPIGSNPPYRFASPALHISPSITTNVVSLRVKRRGDELEFLPRCSGDRRNPASPLGRGIAFTVIASLVDAEADSTRAAIDKLVAGLRATFPFCFT
jgi:hypothetical protein